jgi:DNA-directed RNA polymerase subunit M/transcription elongation factor TFIIS
MASNCNFCGGSLSESNSACERCNVTLAKDESVKSITPANPANKTFDNYCRLCNDFMFTGQRIDSLFRICGNCKPDYRYCRLCDNFVDPQKIICRKCEGVDSEPEKEKGKEEDHKCRNITPVKDEKAPAILFDHHCSLCTDYMYTGPEEDNDVTMCGNCGGNIEIDIRCRLCGDFMYTGTSNDRRVNICGNCGGDPDEESDTEPEKEEVSEKKGEDEEKLQTIPISSSSSIPTELFCKLIHELSNTTLTSEERNAVISALR